MIDFWANFFLRLRAKLIGGRDVMGDSGSGYRFSQNFFSAMHPTMAAIPN
jgi:hypothetical protein